MNNTAYYPPDQTALERNSYRFGALPNVPVGMTFESRQVPLVLYVSFVLIL